MLVRYYSINNGAKKFLAKHGFKPACSIGEVSSNGTKMFKTHVVLKEKS